MGYITCFITGFGVLVFELASFRLLAPYFGVSIYVTGIIINTILLALSIGYVLGGYAADKYRSARLPYLVILGSTVYLFIIYAIYPQLLQLLSFRSVILGSSTAILTMFFLPMVLLAFIPPYFIKLLAHEDHVGKAAGGIFSISTVGSIIGGIATTFLFIPHLGSRMTFFLTVILLLVISVVGLLRFTKSSPLLLLLFIPFTFVSADTSEALYSTESEYNIVMVTEEHDQRFLRLNKLFAHHSKSLNPETKLSDDYYDQFLVAQLFIDANTTLILGNAAGTSMMQARHFFSTRVDGVEIDPVITEVGKEYFGLVLDGKTRIYHEDARTYLIKNQEKYDVIYIDLFAGSPYVPFHVTTIEFFELVKAALSENGVMAINLPPYARGTELEEYILNTIAAVFPHSFLSLRLLYSFKNATDIEKLRAFLNTKEIPLSLAPITSITLKKMRKVTVTSAEKVFTDDYAPVESMAYPILRKLRTFGLNRGLPLTQIP
jgi:spermidine synthase